MALVNVGVLLALWGKRVLLVDWDLEAPGLEAFFRSTETLVGDASVTPGVIDLLEAHASGSALGWRGCLLQAVFLGSTLDMISAGRKSEDYRSRVQGLDWDTLFRVHRIGNYINGLRDEWRESYDFVLIDSRTGITDTGDICTVLLPDALVLMFVTNYQNIGGIQSVVQRAADARSRLPVDRSKLLGVPVPARDEVYNEHDKSLEWKRIFAKEFSYLYKEWLPKEVEPVDALNRLFIPYVTNWSFGECIPVLESQRELQDPTTIGSAYSRLATLLMNRLDWYALDERASVGELQGSRVELMRVRDEADKALLAERAAKEEAEAQFVERQKLARRTLWISTMAIFVAATVGIFVYREFKNQAYIERAAAEQQILELRRQVEKTDIKRTEETKLLLEELKTQRIRAEEAGMAERAAEQRNQRKALDATKKSPN